MYYIPQLTLLSLTSGVGMCHVSVIEDIISGLEAANAGQVSDMGFSVKTQLREGEGQRLCVDCRLIASDGG